MYYYRLATPTDSQEILAVWQRSVTATHTFLTAEEISEIKRELSGFLAQAEVIVVSEETTEILGFASVAEENLNMLFLDSTVIGKGLGSQLFDYMSQTHAFTTLDVNKDNPKALAFYQHKGFEVVSESSLDGQGRPFPILHLKKRA